MSTMQTYDEEALNEIYEELVQKMRVGGQVDSLNQKLGATIGHALDALELSKDINHPLDLFELSKERINAVIIAMYLYFNNIGDSSTKCRETVAKKIGAYLYFTFCNVYNKNDKLQITPVERGSGLYLEAKVEGNNEVLIDVFTPVTRFIKNNLKYDRDSDTMIIKQPYSLLESLENQLPEFSR